MKIDSTLFLVSIPIGNPKDLSIRAKEIIQSSELIIGEEWKTTSKFLKSISVDKEFELLNEHSTFEDINSIAEKIAEKEISCLFSDAGTPLLSDPGLALTKILLSKKIHIKAIPGPSAFLLALVLSGFQTAPFSFLGFLPREEEELNVELKRIKNLKHTLVFYETPYRYKKLISILAKHFSKDTKIFLGLDLTTENEIQWRGTIFELNKILEELPKSPPVIVIENLV
ncbi:MAG: SAM-dependent methyltransferase [Leptospiraceae bacterium]|nr:SAM-dependent methyltransferase [Leptospiraceae bacterium]